MYEQCMHYHRGVLQALGLASLKDSLTTGLCQLQNPALWPTITTMEGD